MDAAFKRVSGNPGPEELDTGVNLIYDPLGYLIYNAQLFISSRKKYVLYIIFCLLTQIKPFLKQQ